MALRPSMDAGCVDKWALFNQVREARDALGVSDRALTILNALLSFHGDAKLAPGGKIVVWPSNDQLSARANGISGATLRRHLAVLVTAGLVVRRDSPNGKRFARRKSDGAVDQAYGFDLSPLVARADEIAGLALQLRREREEIRLAREEASLLRRDIAKVIAAGIAEDPSGWEALADEFAKLRAPCLRALARAELADLLRKLSSLWSTIAKILESHDNRTILSGNAHQIERHIEDRNPESHSKKDLENEGIVCALPAASGETLEPRVGPPGITLRAALESFPAMRDMAPGGSVAHWPAFIALAERVAAMMGIGRPFWRQCVAAMGPAHAAIAVASIHEQGEAITNPGGYLRGLMKAAGQGTFSVPDLLLVRLRQAPSSGQLTPPRCCAEEAAGPAAESAPIVVSAALRQSLLQGRGGRPALPAPRSRIW